ncbi:nuclease [Obba rivulosa]|uniref:Nuclease n=1 Tax=Obba rivulosa TaxID=1052685 RepID=A0A8E2DNK0_9APHY|nr:nuclease [Obba rivulosa]
MRKYTNKFLRRADPPDSGIVANVNTQLASLPPHLLALSAFIIGSASALTARYAYVRYFRRTPNSDWVTPDLLAKRRWVKGYVTSVGDADNFRIYHTPGFGWRWPLKFRRIPAAAKDLKDRTIHIRLAGVDAPEGAHFGRPAQQFSQESLAWLKAHVEGKFVYCQLLRKDQYTRIVAFVHMKPWLLPGFLAPFTGRNVSLDMLRAGWVEVYEQSGAEYGKWGKDEFLRLQAEAQVAQLGIWKYGIGGESAADYKKRYASGSEIVDTRSGGNRASSSTSATSTTTRRQATKTGIMDRFARWVRRW